MSAILKKIEEWAADAMTRLANGGLCASDLGRLVSEARTAEGCKHVCRQRLLYLHASSPSIRSRLISAALHEPVKGSITEIDPEATDFLYTCVHDAILDGWRVIHFPIQMAPFDDREIDILGYEFILEKIEAYDE